MGQDKAETSPRAKGNTDPVYPGRIEKYTYAKINPGKNVGKKRFNIKFRITIYFPVMNKQGKYNYSGNTYNPGNLHMQRKYIYFKKIEDNIYTIEGCGKKEVIFPFLTKG